MAPDLTSEAWAQIRFDYEHTAIPVEEICAGHGISSATLRDRMRRWSWTRRRPPVPREGPPPAPAPVRAPAPPLDSAALRVPIVPAFEPAAPTSEILSQNQTAAPPDVPRVAAGDDAGAPGAGDNSAIVPRLQSAIARVLPAIEATVARLGAGNPHEMERAARALAALTRTLRELNSLLVLHQAPGASHAVDDDPVPEDINEFRRELARRIRAFVDDNTDNANTDNANTDNANTDNANTDFTDDGSRDGFDYGIEHGFESDGDDGTKPQAET